MIKLDKLSEPNVLRINAEQWTKDYKEAKATNATNIDEIKVRYRHPEVKEQIVRETSGKCAYCESKIRHVYPGDVEHIKPKSDFEDDIFSWENLTLSCGECNRRKLNHYDEAFGILNPYKNDPEKHLTAAGSLIFAKLNDSVGQIAYELFELNRTDLVERRADRLFNLQRQLEQYAKEETPILKMLYKRRIEKEVLPDTEYAMVARAFIKLHLKSNGTLRP